MFLCERILTGSVENNDTFCLFLQKRLKLHIFVGVVGATRMISLFSTAHTVTAWHT